MNLNTFLLIDGSIMLIGLPLLMILKEKELIEIIRDFRKLKPKFAKLLVIETEVSHAWSILIPPTHRGRFPR